MASDIRDALRYVMGVIPTPTTLQETRDRQQLESDLMEAQRLQAAAQLDLNVRQAQMQQATSNYRYAPIDHTIDNMWSTYVPHRADQEENRLRLMEIQIKRLRLIAKELLKLCAEPNLETKSVVIDHVQQILEQEGLEWKER